MSNQNLFGFSSLSDYAAKKYGARPTRNPPCQKYQKPRATPKNKSDFGFYPSPYHVVKRLIEIAKLESHHTILEPSAGQGHILDQLNGYDVICGELQEENKKILEE
ncbi:MAG TPA: hypothetical protein VKN14_05445, partial [Flavobacteriaceae bacterium]|nr:hypothetical protein [Flavobacteriaceae bacterium]